MRSRNEVHGKELIAIDGSKFKAVNALENNSGIKKLDDRIARIDQHLENYMSELNEKDDEANTPNPYDN